ncbi:MAG: serine hydrolase domain-containing protein [Pseudomonadota bacterium]
MKHAFRISLPLAGVCLALSACGEGSTTTPNPGTVTPPPSATPSPSPSPDQFAEVKDAIDAFNDDNFAVLVGTGDGIVFSYEKGSFPLDQKVPIASASKWLTGATIYRLVEKGEMSLTDNPQDYLPFWTNDPDDPRSQVTLENLLSFTSGFNAFPESNDCVNDPATTLELCASSIYEAGLDSAPGEAFSYGPEHMHVAAAMAERVTGKAFVDLFSDEIAQPLGMSQATRFTFPSALNPLPSGGARSNAEDYALFLSALLQGNLINDLDEFHASRTVTATILYSPVDGTGAGDWGYALGSFVECDEATFSQDCADDTINSSAGSFGWTPWIDRKNGYWGLIARRGETGSSAVAIRLEQSLQPLIIEALAD